MRSVLPRKYYYFFWLVEPVLTVAGALSAMIYPEHFARDMLSERVERSTMNLGRTSRGQMIICELGSCFMLLAMLSLSLLYIIKKHLNDRPAIQEKLVKGLLVPLAIADLLHIAVTLLPLPVSHLKSPSEWTHILHCTVWITLTLFVVRVSWLLGIGRPTAKSLSKVQPISTKGQRPIPLPKTQSELSVERAVKAEASVHDAPPNPVGGQGSSTPRRRGKASGGSRLVD
ncbi:hypothetical protein I317_06284 [Kwoniella heveanensis CBS 569]|uniref:DUF7704 domain-containing protein n=1 Tax=Kwoniella heveanensis BCC8398 TaxID=1296120 RepID=A0A1B9GV94_9TREE|nr:hypothetical protein I316_03495 [Kwoniella heveanensis BCC8398]OCF39910.1 hypothetical protein I317_06284 [Kwoniella heveanensis CBS 569]